MAIAAVHGQVRIADIDRVWIPDRADEGTLIPLRDADLVLQQDMAEIAGFGQNLSIFTHMIPVVAAEATRRMPMPPVAGEVSPADFH